jgi:hypothetical protein
MRKIIAAVASLTAITALAVPALASADVARYQFQTAAFTLTQPAGSLGQWNSVRTHNISVTVNPCTNTVEGTGVETGPGPTLNENITGSSATAPSASRPTARTTSASRWSTHRPTAPIVPMAP